MSTLNFLYSQSHLLAEDWLSVSSLHSIYVAQYGNPQGKPVLFIHGGPGAGCHPSHSCFFDPEFYRIFLVDQRGAGRSIPFGEMHENNTEALIADFEMIRNKFHIDQWLLFGGSWGSTLSLAYAEKHPERCLGLILRGIWLARQQEIDFFFNGIAHTHPERAEEFYQFIPTEERSDILFAYYQRLMNPDPEIHMPAAVAFARYELGSSLHSPHLDDKVIADRVLTLGLSRTECHYMMHHMFLRHNQLIDDLHLIQHLPCHLIHGRYDAICPYAGAYELKSHWPQAELITVTQGGHAATDPEIAKALLNSTNQFREILSSL